MSESQAHIELVRVALKFIRSKVDPDLHSVIQFDAANSLRPAKVIGNFIPDVLFWHGNQLIIGEAKTVNDFSMPHSYKQYDAYMRECQNFYGQAMLVISVPWEMLATAKNYFRRLKKLYCVNFSIFVIDEFGRPFEI